MHYIDKTHWFIGTRMLLNENYPIVFRSINGTCVKSNSSWKNDEEADAVISCLDELLAGNWNGRPVHGDDIGIITPYTAQNKLIQSRITHHSDIMVKSPESFQGQEKNIIIVSTVRTGPLGFLRDEKV